MSSPEFLIIASRPELYAENDKPNCCVDVKFVRDVEIPPLESNGGISTIVDLELKARCVGADGYLPYLLLPRGRLGGSSSCRFNGSIEDTPLRLANHVGVIDQGYQGSLRVALRNHSDAAWKCQAGDSYFQLVVADQKTQAVVRIVSPEHEAFQVQTLRNEGGFGSTGAAGTATIHLEEVKIHKQTPSQDYIKALAATMECIRQSHAAHVDIHNRAELIGMFIDGIKTVVDTTPGPAERLACVDTTIDSLVAALDTSNTANTAKTADISRATSDSSPEHVVSEGVESSESTCPIEDARNEIIIGIFESSCAIEDAKKEIIVLKDEITDKESLIKDQENIIMTIKTDIVRANAKLALLRTIAGDATDHN